jgi:hypothetical protein
VLRDGRRGEVGGPDLFLSILQVSRRYVVSHP